MAFVVAKRLRHFCWYMHGDQEVTGVSSIDLALWTAWTSGHLVLMMVVNVRDEDGFISYREAVGILRP